MILSVTYESPDVLRIYPPQLDIDGKALAERVDGLAMHDMDLGACQEKLEKASEEASYFDEKLTDLKEVVKDAIRELDEILVEKPTKPEIMAKLAELKKKLEDEHA